MTDGYGVVVIAPLLLLICHNQGAFALGKVVSRFDHTGKEGVVALVRVRSSRGCAARCIAAAPPPPPPVLVPVRLSLALARLKCFGLGSAIIRDRPSALGRSDTRA